MAIADGGLDDFVPALLGALASIPASFSGLAVATGAEPAPDALAAPDAVFPPTDLFVAPPLPAPTALFAAGIELAPGVAFDTGDLPAPAFAAGVLPPPADLFAAGDELAPSVALDAGVLPAPDDLFAAGDELAPGDDAAPGVEVAAGAEIAPGAESPPLDPAVDGAGNAWEPAPMELDDPMEVDNNAEDGRVHEDPEGMWDPMDIQEDATMTLRRGGWRRVTPVLVHGRRRRVMALPLGVPAHRFAGPYTIPWYKGVVYKVIKDNIYKKKMDQT
jgi:hypothetical protein